MFAVLGQAVGRQQVDDLAAQPAEGLHPRCCPQDRGWRHWAPASFLRLVVDRAGVRDEEAEAVLETLAEHIAGSEVNDLISRLPVALHEPLRRGSERSGGKATRMSPDEFVTRVAERTGQSVEQARDDVRAVMVMLREAVGDDEFFDVAVQLPRGYDAVLAVR